MFIDQIKRLRRSSRGGISLLEVLISLGVLSIGLLGVALLIPVAQFKTKQGLLEDRKALLGRGAVREFRVRGLNDPGSPFFPNWIGYPYQMSDPQANTQVFQATMGVIRKPYCLDPLMIAAQFDPAGTKSVSLEATAFFPNGTWKSGSAPVGMTRITLDSNVTMGGLQKSVAILSSRMAEEIFLLGDDLVTEVAADRAELPPLQQYLADGNLVPRKRYANGNLSWMATIVPDPGPAASSLRRFNTLASDAVRNDQYVLSVVIFDRRVLDPTEEAVGLIDIANGAGPGEITVVSSTAGVSKFTMNDIRVGDWVMLGRVLKTKVPGKTTPVLVPSFRWTRVINADDPEPSLDDPSATSRNLTVALADTSGLAGTTPTLTYVRGIIAVFEKTIRLESSSQ